MTNLLIASSPTLAFIVPIRDALEQLASSSISVSAEVEVTYEQVYVDLGVRGEVLSRKASHEKEHELCTRD